MQKKLSEWAKENGVLYHTAYNQFKHNKLPVKAFKTNTGAIIVDLPEQEVKNQLTTLNVAPQSVSFEETISASRRNISSTQERTDKYINIDNGLVPFTKSSSGFDGQYSRSTVSIQDAIILCQKAYYNFAIFRNTIDLMTEFSTNDIYFQGGSSKSRAFFKALWKKLNIAGLQDKFFREYYRSGNVLIYRFNTTVQPSDIVKLTQTFGSSLDEPLTLPSKYIIINPADVQVGGNISFVNNVFYKVLNDYEIERLRDPKTDDDIEVFESLPPNIKKQIKESKSQNILLPLDRANLYAVFYKKQDYEPMAVPMGYPVLEDINWKAELKKIDMAISRTVQQAILLVTCGAEPEKGGINQKSIDALQAIFKNESVGRVLVSDYTTNAKFVIPDIANILDPKKYEVVDRDIRVGLNNILVGEGEKFANESLKLKVFVERLKMAREAFINEFLTPEIIRISKSLGFKNYPTPIFQDIDLKNEVEFSRVYTRLIELGVLTPTEGLEALESGRLPTEEESEEAQRKFKTLKNDGLYQPITSNSSNQSNDTDNSPSTKQTISQPGGRPAGTKRKQSTKTINPIGGSNYSLTKIKDFLIQTSALEHQVEKALLKKFKVKTLSPEQKDVSVGIVEVIISNESPETWESSIEKYISCPIDTNIDQVNKIQEIAANHQVNSYIASVLFHSKV